jgi:hypothetical protein
MNIVIYVAINIVRVDSKTPTIKVVYIKKAIVCIVTIEISNMLSFIDEV